MSRRSSTGGGHQYYPHPQQLDLNSPTSPGATSVWVGSHPSPDHAHLHGHALGNGDDSALRHNAKSLSVNKSGVDEGRYVVVSVRDSASDSEPNSRRSSEVHSPQSSGFRSTSFDSHPSSPSSPVRGGRVSTSSLDSGGPFSPRVNDSPQYPHNGHLQSASTLPRNLGSRSTSSYSDDNGYHSATIARTASLQKNDSGRNHRSPAIVRTGSYQNPSFTGNFKNTSLFGNTGRNNSYPRNYESHSVHTARNTNNDSSPVRNTSNDSFSVNSPRHTTNTNMLGSNNLQGSGVVGNTSVLLGTGNFPGTALAGNTSNVLGGPGSMLGSTSTLYNGGTFLPAAASSMTTLPQTAYDPSAYLLQQQLSPELLAASLGQTLSLAPSLSLSPTQSLQTVNFTQPQLMSLPQAQSLQSLNFPQTQPLQSLSLGQTQTLSFPQTQPLNLPQTQPMNFSQTQPMNLPQTQPINLPQTQPMTLPQTQSLQSLNLSQAGSLLSPTLTQTQALQSMESAQGVAEAQQSQPEPHMPYLGHSFDMLSAAVAANQAVTSPTLQSPTSPPFSPQLLPMGTTSGLPPTLTGIPPAGQTSLSPPPPQGSPSLFHDPCPKPSVSRTSSNELGVQKRGLHATSSLDHTDDQGTSGVGSSVPSSPSDYSPTSPHSDLHLTTSSDEGQGHVLQVEPSYLRPKDKQACLRCGKKVYAMEKLGPVKDVLYHKTCFTCAACHTTLNLKNFHHNDADLGDLNVYCISHKPVPKANPLDSHSVGIQRALTVPKRERVNDQIRGGPDSHTNIHVDTNSVSIRAALHVPAQDLASSIKTREGAWFREDRKAEATPPRDVVRHDWSKPEYQGSRSLYINPS